jgi:thimet oligopeptidase
MHRLKLAALAAALCVLAAFAPLASQGAPRPLVPLLDAAAVTRNCEATLERGRKDVAAMEKRSGPVGFLDEWNRLQIGLEDINAIYLLGSVSPDKAVRDAAEPCLVKLTTFITEVYQSERLFKRVQALEPANAHQAKLRKDLVEAFEDSGVALPVEKRARAKAIIDKVEELRQEFDRDIRDDPTRVTLTPAEMEGMPPAYLKAHEGQRDKNGNYVLTLQYPSYVPFMANARNEDARRRYYLAKLSEGGAKNLERLYEIFRLRKELAALHGLPTFAHYSLRRKMAGTPEAVNSFLANVKDQVTDLEKRDIEELRAEKARDTGKPAAETKVNHWDVSYYQERVRKARYSVDQEQLRKYFPTDKSIDFVLAIASRLYGVRFKEAKVAAWHPDVRYFDVLDAKTGAFVSGFYLDLFPREGKFGHAAAFPVRGASTRARRTPLSVLVTNFNKEGLDHSELETLLHEFGHVLHGVLSKAEYNPHAGASVKVDFVEAPSQMFEEWARREQTLAVFRQVCPQCPQLTADEIARLESARKYARGTRYARQWLFGAFDMALSTDPQPPLAIWKNLEGATPLGHVEGTLFPASFSHLTAQYGAGYYGYMWSEVLALDMLSAFKGDLLDPATGRRYRDEILAQGGQREEMEMVRRFLGRDPSPEAFFAEITGKR